MCGSMPLLTEVALRMRVGPLALIFGLREFFTVAYGPVVTHLFPDVQLEAYRHLALYVNLVSEVFMDLNNCSKYRMGCKKLSNVQVNP